jgi:AcrR family transcriptional regulator
MARPATNHEAKKEQIAEIALKVFAKYGFAGTTNKLIAKEAKEMSADGTGISPALIYHYFPEGKGELFAASIRRLPPLQSVEHLLKETNDPPEVFLPMVARTYNEFLKTPELRSIFRIIFMEGTHQPDLPYAVMSQFVPNLLQPFLRYFERQVAAGTIRPMKFDQLVMQTMGPIIMRRIAFSILPVEQLPIQLSDDEEFIDSLVQTLLGSIRPD